MTQVFHSLAEIPANFGQTAVTIGNFDGVHLGHLALIEAVKQDAREHNAKSLAITFHPHPQQFFAPADAPRLLTPLSERIALLAQSGLDAILVLPFNAVLASLSAREFLQTILIDKLHCVRLHEGANFRLGHRAEAGVTELTALGAELGFTLTIHPAVCVRGQEISSSAIRAALAEGHLPQARHMLGHPFSILSTQARGHGIGSRLTVPTINLADYPDQLPANGVYITRIRIQEKTFQAVTNIGQRPTFGTGFAVESYLLDFEPMDLTPSTPIELTFLFRLREERKFPSPEALKAQIMHDVASAQRYFRRTSSL